MKLVREPAETLEKHLEKKDFSIRSNTEYTHSRFSYPKQE